MLPVSYYFIRTVSTRVISVIRVLNNCYEHKEKGEKKYSTKRLTGNLNQ